MRRTSVWCPWGVVLVVIHNVKAVTRGTAKRWSVTVRGKPSGGAPRRYPGGNWRVCKTARESTCPRVTPYRLVPLRWPR